MKRGSVAAAVVAAALSAAPAAGAQSYEVGVGKADLSWHVGAESPQSDALTFRGLHSRLWAKAIVIRPPGGAPLALVRTDTLLITGDLYEGVVLRVEEATGLAPERLLLAATHTHTANNGLYPHAVHSALYRSFDPREREFLADRIAAAIADAFADLRPATLAVGSTQRGFTDFNRRYTERESTGEPPFANDPSRIDPEIGVLRFDDAATGEPLAVVMNKGLHPVVTISEPLLSSDLVGYAERELELALPGAMGIWFTGAQGDQDPIHVRYSYPEAEWAGGVLGRRAARLARRLRPRPIRRARVAEKLVPLPAPGGPQPSLGVSGGLRVPVPAPAPLAVPSSIRLQVVELAARGSGRTALVTWPGEPIRDLGISLKEKMRALGYRHAYVMGLANDWAGYWLTPEEYDREMYEWTLMFYGRESALYIEHHLVDLARAFATGEPPEQVPLPPKALADREATRASAQTGVPPGEAPPPDPEPAALEQPEPLRRTEVARFGWSGGSPRVPHGWMPAVFVERRTGDRWTAVAREGAGDVLLAHEGGSSWSARWQPRHDAPRGVYRMRVEGNRQTSAGPAGYELASREFRLRRCRCIEPGRLRARRRGSSYSVTLSARYAPGPDEGFRLLRTWVRTGRPLVRVVRRGRTVGRLRLRYAERRATMRRRALVNNVDGRELPITTAEPVERGSFRGRWRGARGARFELVRARDRFGNR